MKKILLLFVLIVISQSVDAKVVRDYSYVPNYSVGQASNGFYGLTALERQVFNRTFEYDFAKNRIERLEQKVFGALQGGTLDERFAMLSSAVKNYKAYNQYGYAPQSVYNQYRAPLFTGAAGGDWKNLLWSNFRNRFVGMPTGYTPAMDPAYMDYFEAERAMMGSGYSADYRTNRGYSRSNVNRGVGTGVTILD